MSLNEVGMGNPKLGVVMPVRNAMPYLASAIRSILSQTFEDFEFIVGDDNSNDGSRECLREFARSDSRIRLLESDVRLGTVGSANWVASQTRAPIVARMDADDISHPERLQRQWDALAAHPEAVLVGSLHDTIDGSGKLILERDRSLLLKARMPPIAHGSIMYRRDAFQRVGGYRPESDYFEDIDLYCRLSAIGSILVVADSLFSYRISGVSTRLTDNQDAVEERLDRYFSAWQWQQCSAQTHLDDDSELPFRSARTRRLSPGVFVVLGTLRLWSGGSPGVLLRMTRRMRFRPLQESIGPLLWALCGSLSPALTRILLRVRVHWRNRGASALIRDGHVYQWRHRGAAIDLGPPESRAEKSDSYTRRSTA